MEGTYPLPEAQRDRFTARISIGYPAGHDELAMLAAHGSSSPLDDLKPVAHASDVRALIAAVRGVHVAEQVRQYIVELITATRTAPALRLGASPRAALHLLRASRPGERFVVHRLIAAGAVNRRANELSSRRVDGVGIEAQRLVPEA
jgi:MoxR-like ATPase